jgi:acetyl esterase/lipase
MAGELDALFGDLDRWAAAREAGVETVRYGGHADQVLDLRLPATGSAASLALVLHGGFWRAPYTRSTTTALSVAVTDTGWATANVEYRRLGPGAFRPMLDDVAAAARSLTGFERVVAIGHSAGGHLALWLAAEHAVDAAVALGGVYDLTAAAEAGLGGQAVGELMGGAPAELPEDYRLADPAARLPLGRPHVLVHGTRDDRVPIEHARAFARRAQAAGDDCRLIEVDGDHFDPIDPRTSCWPIVRDALDSLRQSRL